MALLLSSCAQVPIKDQEWFGDEGSLGAHAFHTLTNDERQVSKDEWDNLRFGMVCSKAESLADTKAVIEKLCSEANNCTYEVQQAITAFFDHLGTLRRETATALK